MHQCERPLERLAVVCVWFRTVQAYIRSGGSVILKSVVGLNAANELCSAMPMPRRTPPAIVIRVKNDMMPRPYGRGSPFLSLPTPAMLMLDPLYDMMMGVKAKCSAIDV